jgi:hypothetical protein
MASGRTAIVAAFVLLSVGLAHGKDYCFNSTSPPNPAPHDDPDILVIAKRFTFPRPGDCRPIVGFDVGMTNQTFPRPASGSACLNSAGTKLHVGIMLHGAAGPPEIYTDSEIHVHMVVPYPALSGGAVYIRQDLPGISIQRSDAVVGPCGFSFPVPGS